MNSNNYDQNHVDHDFFCVIPQDDEFVNSDDYHRSDELFLINPLDNESVNSNTMPPYLCLCQQLQEQQFEILYIVSELLLSDVNWDTLFYTDMDWFQQQQQPPPLQPLLLLLLLPPPPQPPQPPPAIMHDPVDQSNTNYSRFLSFLEFDDSFLTPWNWNPFASQNHDSNDCSTRYMNFQPGSLFAHEGDDLNLEQSSSSSQTDSFKQPPNSSETDSEEQSSSCESDDEDWSNSTEDDEEQTNSAESDADDWSNSSETTSEYEY